MSSGGDVNAFANGLMGGISGTSKIMDIAKSKKEGVDQPEVKTEQESESSSPWALLSGIVGGLAGSDVGKSTLAGGVVDKGLKDSIAGKVLGGVSLGDTIGGKLLGGKGLAGGLLGGLFK